MTQQQRIAELEAQLAASQARECTMREALGRNHEWHLTQDDCEPYQESELWQVNTAALATSGTCPHQQEACRMREALVMWRRFAAECEQRKITIPLWASMLNETAVELTEAALATSGTCPHQQEACRMREALETIKTRLTLGRSIEAGIWLEKYKRWSWEPEAVIGESLESVDAALAASGPCPHAAELAAAKTERDGLAAALEPFRKYIELRYAIFSKHALDSVPTLQVSHTGRFGVSAAEITQADWDRIRYALVPGVGVDAEKGGNG
jgi:hypothetical protein